jgi:hypothetical protein
MPALHTVKPEISFGYVTVHFTCQAPEGADCRVECAETCGAESWPCYDDEGLPEQREHPRKDSGECQVIIWLEDDGIENHVAKSEVLREAPIFVRWTGDGYQWAFEEALLG